MRRILRGSIVPVMCPSVLESRGRRDQKADGHKCVPPGVVALMLRPAWPPLTAVATRVLAMGL